MVRVVVELNSSLKIMERYITIETLKNYYRGQWVDANSSDILAVHNPAFNEIKGQVPLTAAGEVEKAVRVASTAFEDWRRTPAASRIQPLFKLKDLLEDHIDDIARMTSTENGKTLGESAGEMRRAFENVEVRGIMLSGMQVDAWGCLSPIGLIWLVRSRKMLSKKSKIEVSRTYLFQLKS